MPDYLTPGYRNSGEGRPVWKRPLFIILAVLTVLVVVGAAYFFSSDGTSGLVAPVIGLEIHGGRARDVLMGEFRVVMEVTTDN